MIKKILVIGMIGSVLSVSAVNGPAAKPEMSVRERVMQELEAKRVALMNRIHVTQADLQKVNTHIKKYMKNMKEHSDTTIWETRVFKLF